MPGRAGLTRASMRATARLVAEAGPAGMTRLAVVRSEPPLVLRRTGPPGRCAQVHVVGGAAGPLAGDRLRLEVDVGPGASLLLRTVAASVALPGSGEDWSRFELDVRVDAGAELSWSPEPLVAAHGCRHEVSAVVDVAEGGRLTWRDELVCGRHGERGGDAHSTLAVTYAGRQLLVHELAVGPSAPGWDGPAVLGAARAVGSLLVAGPDWPGEVAERAGPEWAVLPLAGPGVLVTALAADALELRRRLQEASPHWAESDQ